MRYLFYLVFLMASCTIPYLICYSLITWFDKNEETSLLSAVLIFSLYILLYMLRFFAFIFIALISFCFKNYFTSLYKYNSLIFLVLFIVDIILCHILDPLLGTNYFKTEGFFCYIGFLSLTSTYFPFWLVFGIRNSVCWIKDLIKRKNIKKI